MAQIHAEFSQALAAFPQTSNWQNIEAPIFALRAIARNVDDSPYLPQVPHIHSYFLTLRF